MTICAVVAQQINSIDLLFDILMKELFAQILTGIELQSAKNTPANVIASIGKNQNELLRCFAELGTFFVVN
jgi:hypothetical protein